MINLLKKTIVLASHNTNKLLELQTILVHYDVKLTKSSDYNLKDPVEDGTTFAQNALIKAKFVAEETGLIALGDDSGLEIVALNNQPGIFSARWAINNDYNIAIHTIENLMNKQHLETGIKNWEARFVCVLCLYFPRTKIFEFFTGIVKGSITFPKKGNNGFAYDSIFKPNGYDITFAEMESVFKNTISHRQHAINNLVKYCFPTVA